jgi:chemotaxis protein MotB
MNSRDRLRKKTKGQDEWLVAYADLLTNLLVFFAVIMSASQVSQTKMQKVAQQISGQTQEKDLVEIKKDLDQKIKEKNYEKVITTSMDDDGLRVSIDAAVVFAPGAANIPEEYYRPLAEVMKEALPYARVYRFAVEGYADPTPLSGTSTYRNNWELSGARAQSILFMLSGIGVAENRLHTEGYGSSRTLPESKLQGLSEQERLAKHRRVVIRIY